MEPITHFLTGACIGRAGLNRKTAYATLAAVLAAEAADIDILWSFAGPVEELKHHRGITHTFIAVPVVAAAVVGVVWLYDRWRRTRASRNANALNQSATAPPTLRWGWLYWTALLSALSHLLLDWTTNYGVRPFFPFNPHWYAVVIVPFILAGTGTALVFSPAANAVLAAVRSHEVGQASGANNAIRQVGGVFGIAVLSTVFSRLGGYASPQQFVDGLQPAVLVGSGVVALGALAALFVPGLRALRPRTVAPVSLGGHEEAGAAV